METTKMSFVELRKSMIGEILTTTNGQNNIEWNLTGLWLCWNDLQELYHNQTMYWCITSYTNSTYWSLPEEQDAYDRIYKITRIGKWEYNVELIKMTE